MAETKTEAGSWLPKGGLLDPETFAERHLVLRVVLGLHVPVLAAFALVQAVSPAAVAAALLLPASCLAAATVFSSQRARAVFATAGLLACSAALIALAGGAAAAHLHLFIVVGLVALYQDWPPFLCAIGFAFLSNAVSATLLPDTLGGGREDIAVWAAAECAAIVLASAAQVLFWRATERSQAKASALATDLVLAEQRSAQRASVSELFVNLARRNQSLLDRQLALIDDLESSEQDPDALAELFKLDHLATRIRRNAESLLVLSGEEPARRWGAPVALAEVARAAVAEVEDFNRAVITVDDGVAVSGRAVADLAHLLAELVENAMAFSPPTLPVHVKGKRTADGRCLLVVEDRGIGMAAADLELINERLAAPDEDVELELDRRLGFRVVARLAARYGVKVALAPTPGGGGTTAIVSIPADLVAGGAPDDRPADDVEPDAAQPLDDVEAVAVAERPAPETVAIVAAPLVPAPTPDLPLLPPVAVPVPQPVAAPTPAPVAAPSLPEPLVASAPAPAAEPVGQPALLAAAPPAADRPAGTVVPVPVAAAAPVDEAPAALPVRTPRPVPSDPTPAPVPLGRLAPPAATAAASPSLPPLATAGPSLPPPAAPGLPKRTPASTSWPAPPKPSVAGGLPQRGPARPPADGAAQRSPEQARLLLSRFQSGQLAGRTAADARRDELAVSAAAPLAAETEEDR